MSEIECHKNDGIQIESCDKSDIGVIENLKKWWHKIHQRKYKLNQYFNISSFLIDKSKWQFSREFKSIGVTN